MKRQDEPLSERIARSPRPDTVDGKSPARRDYRFEGRKPDLLGATRADGIQVLGDVRLSGKVARPAEKGSAGKRFAPGCGEEGYRGGGSRRGRIARRREAPANGERIFGDDRLEPRHQIRLRFQRQRPAARAPYDAGLGEGRQCQGASHDCRRLARCGKSHDARLEAKSVKGQSPRSGLTAPNASA